MVKVGVVGFGTIGERLADGIDAQPDMELVGVVDVAPSLPIQALVESGRGYDIYCGLDEKVDDLKKAGVPVAGTMDDFLSKVDVVADAASPGVGAQNKVKYGKAGVKAIFQGGEAAGTGMRFTPLGNYDKAVGQDFLHAISCNTTGIARCVLSLDRDIGVTEFLSLIVRRAADISETHKGPVNAAMIAKIPSHQAEDFFEITPHIKAFTSVVTVPITHGHVQTVQVTLKKEVTKDDILDIFNKENRLRIFKLSDGFLSNSHVFDYCRDLGKHRADMYDCPVWDETIYVDADDKRKVWFTQMIPQEAIVIPENIDGIRAMMKLQESGEAAIAATDKALKLS